MENIHKPTLIHSRYRVAVFVLHFWVQDSTLQLSATGAKCSLTANPLRRIQGSGLVCSGEWRRERGAARRHVLYSCSN